jgi:CheY-like chemotaxis protein
MAADANLYSAEAVIGALASATEKAVVCVDEQSAISILLRTFREVLEVHAAVFYTPTGTGYAAMLQETGIARVMKPPQEITAELATYVRAAQHVVTSEDAVFQIGHLRMLPATSAASSIWSDVRRGDMEFGIVAAFDASERSFRKTELQITRIVAIQIALCVELIRARKAASTAQTHSTSAELNRYLEASQVVGSVARDLINPLTAMLGYIELMRGEQLDDNSKRYLEKLQLQAEKTQQMVMALNSSSHAAPIMLKAQMERQAEAEISKRAPAEAPPLSRARVLIVQKNEATLEFKKSVLSTLHADLVTTFSGADAIQLLQNEDVQAVIVDDELEGEWPGRRLYGWICEHRPDLRDRVLLTVSTKPKPEIQEMIEESQVPYVSKPLQIVELYAGVQHILGQKPKKTIN